MLPFAVQDTPSQFSVTKVHEPWERRLSIDSRGFVSGLVKCTDIYYLVFQTKVFLLNNFLHFPCECIIKEAEIMTPFSVVAPLNFLCGVLLV